MFLCLDGPLEKCKKRQKIAKLGNLSLVSRGKCSTYDQTFDFAARNYFMKKYLKLAKI